MDRLVDAFNYEDGWSQPIDPARPRAGLEPEADPRDLIRDYLSLRVELGTVRDRSDIVAAPEAGLEVPRQGKQDVTVRDPYSENRWRRG